MIEVHLYGKLRRLVEDAKCNADTVMIVEHVEGETFQHLIERLGLQMSDLGDCFIDGNLAHVDDEVKDDSRVGLFPFNMVLLCGGQHLKGHGYTQSDHEVDYY
ncbi:MoaD/ThiS family protein [Candidatus Thorarchaeota archaeon]|nr:MAG: MoaD/ThiS family protein [Candidatus Thorarchaeota archaeon]